MFESDLSEIPSELIRSVLCETIEKKLNSKKYNIVVKSAVQTGEGNFIGDIFRIFINNEDQNKSNELESLSKLILKLAPQNEGRRNQFHSRPLFLREIYMYDEVN